MSTPTLYLDCLILASAAYPSGFSYSVFAAFRRGATRAVSTVFLAILVLPYVVVASTVWALRPALLSFQTTTWLLLGLAALFALVALLIEYGLHALVSYRAHGVIPRRITMPGFWRVRLSATDYLLLGLIVVGEEVIYREIWLGTLQNSLGFPAFMAVGISSLAYGLNHLAFGRVAVVSKTLTGLLYGGLYLFGESIWLPILTHGLQNAILFMLVRENDG